MVSIYTKGQKVVIKPVTAGNLSPRDSDIAQYAGQSGEVTDLYSISPRAGQVLYMYTVQMDADDRDIIVHEDELGPYVG